MLMTNCMNVVRLACSVVGDSVAFYSLKCSWTWWFEEGFGSSSVWTVCSVSVIFLLWQRAAGDLGEIILSSYSIHSSSIQEYIHLSVLWELCIILLFCMTLFLRPICSCLCDVGCSLVPRPVCLEQTA